MRALFGLLGLVVVLAIVGIAAKKQLAAAPGPAGQGDAAGAATVAPRQQAEQVRQSVDALMQAPRPMPDDSR